MNVRFSEKVLVLIEGPKWCGKTTTAKQLAKSVLDLGDASVLKQSTQMIEISPKSLLEGKTPRLIDEWQALPPIWDSIRSEVDKRGSLLSLSLQVLLYFRMPMRPFIVEQGDSHIS